MARFFSQPGREFFDLFEEAAGNGARAATLLRELLEQWPDAGDAVARIGECEATGDRITHDIHQRLNKTFVTPIDREDILDLTNDLDDIVDVIDEVADFMGLYKIEAPMAQSLQMAEILEQACRNIVGAMPRLRTFADVSHFTVEIHRLENEGDRAVRTALASLFDTGIDPMVVIRWKDLFERLERAIDATEHVANTLQGIVIKNA